MISVRRQRRHRTWPVIVALALGAGVMPFTGFAGIGPAIPTTVAADPTPAPTADPAPGPSPTSPAASPAVTPDPTAAPSPDPTPTIDPGATIAPDPTTGAGPAPTPTALPTAQPTVDPSTGPDASPGPSPASTPYAGEPSPSPQPGPEPSIEPSPFPYALVDPSEGPAASGDPGLFSLSGITYALSPGQRQGDPVGPAIPIYELKLPALVVDPDSPHGGGGVNGSDCAACHAAHRGQQADLVAAAGAQAAICYACHAPGRGASDIRSAFTGSPPNDAATDAYFSHPVDGASGTAAGTCAECHNPHLSSTDRPVQSTTGWTAEGPIAAAEGVAVLNGNPGDAPTYSAVSTPPLTYEYELCLRCHSGAEGPLPTRSAAHPSWWALDAGVEFNPANSSYHPVEAAGRNVSAQMAASLAGTSPFKAWDFRVDSTIRCTSCHGDPSSVNQVASGTPLTPSADASEATHGSPNRGILTAPYRDRTLKASTEPYDPEDFALCYLCHAERPFADANVDPSAPDTAFPLHGFHVAGTKVQAAGGEATAGLSIDVAGDGQGLATCSECHFRSHSTAIAYAPGDTTPVARPDGATSLVNFAPDVRPAGGTLAWTPPDGSGEGSCTLTCHGHEHSAAVDTYEVAPATGFTASPTSGSAGGLGLTVQFTDATRYATRDTATWSWDFGDPASGSANASIAQSPSHTYASAGTYTVTLTVTRIAAPGLATTATRTAYITVRP